jgi:hypothetical protein
MTLREQPRLIAEAEQPGEAGTPFEPGIASTTYPVPGTEQEYPRRANPGSESA